MNSLNKLLPVSHNLINNKNFLIFEDSLLFFQVIFCFLKHKLIRISESHFHNQIQKISRVE